MQESNPPVSYELPVTQAGRVRLTPRLRERHLTQYVEQAIVQASGTVLRIWLWSDRDNIEIRLPLEEFRAGRPYSRSFHDWAVNVDRWRTPGKSPEGSDADRLERGTLDIDEGKAGAKDTIEATVRVFEGERP